MCRRATHHPHEGGMKNPAFRGILNLMPSVAGLGVAPSLGDYASVISSLDECRTMSFLRFSLRIRRIVSTDSTFSLYERSLSSALSCPC